MNQTDRIAVITDAHANLPALEAALAAIRADGATAIYHTGDAIGIGPFPAEVLDRLLHTPSLHLVMGNHDALFAFGLPDPLPPWMSEGELAHQRWVHAQLDPALQSVIASWPWVIEENLAGKRICFVHYGLDETGHDLIPVVPQPGPVDLDRLFARHGAQVVFYGHDHRPGAMTSEDAGRAWYVNPGTLGCGSEPMARYALWEIDRDGGQRLTLRAVRYDPEPLFRAFEEREVPERAFIKAVFFGRPG